MNESPDLEKVLEKFDKELPCVNHGCDNNGVFMDYDKNGDPEQRQCEYCYRERLPIKDFIRTHWPKPDPRFVEVGKIKWPGKDPYSSEWNDAINACQAAVLKAGEKG